MGTSSITIGKRAQHRGVLGERRPAFLADALTQEFSAIDPTGIDNPTRPGERTSTECYAFEDQLEWFWERVRDQVCEEVGFTPTKRLMRLKRLGDGGFYGSHIDGAYPGAELPLVSFLYYIGDRSTYQGGQLLFDDEAIDPEDDLLVMFNASDPHAVSLVTSTPGHEALRVTIAGCIS